MRETADGADEVELLGTWFRDASLRDIVLEGNVVTGTFEQSVRHDGVDREELPASSPAEGTRWYRALRVPVVACRFTVREATSLEADDLEDPVTDMWWDGAGRKLVFDNGLAIGCVRPNLEIEASDRIVGWRKFKFWRLLNAESEGPWQGD